MKATQNDITKRLEGFKEAAREKGVKMTHQRLEIYKELVSSDTHPSAEMVHRAVKKKMPTISLDTVYRTLWLFTDLGLINTLGLRQDSVHFDTNLERHHHFICTRCGLTRDFYSQRLDRLTLPPHDAHFGAVENTHVELHGICKTCLENDTQERVTG